MNYTEYKELHRQILSGEVKTPLYEKEAYRHYVQLSQARINRWDKRLKLDEDAARIIRDADRPTHWIIITEPWCGDAAHAIPFLMALIDLNPRITYEIQLRDSEPFLIDNYLTNGGKSIPKLIVRDEQGTDLFTWGPRPAGAQQLFEKMKKEEADYDTISIEIQKWYNKDKGQSTVKEIASLWKEAVDTLEVRSALLER